MGVVVELIAIFQLNLGCSSGCSERESWRIMAPALQAACHS